MTIGLTKSRGPATTQFSSKARMNLLMFMTVYTVMMLSIVMIPQTVDAEKPLTELFSMTAFSGSWAVFEKFNWLGKMLNFCISAFCLVGLVLVVIRFTLTILYKSNESIFDRVYELKATGKGQKAAGIPAMLKEVGNGNYGVGADVILGFVLSLMPNVKQYSDYNPEKMAFNLKEDDTITTYVLKMSLPTIMTIFFFSIGFNGTLWRAYGNVVDAMATAAEGACEVQLAGYVEKAMNAGSYYKFSFDTKNEWGGFQESIAKDMYNQMLLKSEDLSSAVMRSMGAKVQEAVGSISREQVAMYTERNLNGTNYKSLKDYSEQAKNLTKNVDINNNAESFESEDSTTFTSCWRMNWSDTDGFSLAPVSGGTSDPNSFYLHLYISRKSNADDQRYFSQKAVHDLATDETGTTTSYNIVDSGDLIRKLNGLAGGDMTEAGLRKANGVTEVNTAPDIAKGSDGPFFKIKHEGDEYIYDVNSKTWYTPKN